MDFAVQLGGDKAHTTKTEMMLPLLQLVPSPNTLDTWYAGECDQGRQGS